MKKNMDTSTILRVYGVRIRTWVPSQRDIAESLEDNVTYPRTWKQTQF